MKISLPFAIILLLAASVDASGSRATRPSRKGTRTKCDPEVQALIRPSADVRTLSRTSGIPYSTVRQWITEGRLKAYKVAGARVRVYLDDWEALWVPVNDDSND